MKWYTVPCMVFGTGTSLIISGCSNPAGPGLGGWGLVYSNSFEVASDTVGWTGYGMKFVDDDAAPGSGNRSLFVSGGCIVPHAEHMVGVVPQNSKFIFSCWGKNLSNGGAVILRTSDENEIGITIHDSVWTHHQSADTLYCPAGSTLWLTMYSGGIFASAMKVDLVQIIRIR